MQVKQHTKYLVKYVKEKNKKNPHTKSIITPFMKNTYQKSLLPWEHKSCMYMHMSTELRSKKIKHAKYTKENSV